MKNAEAKEILHEGGCEISSNIAKIPSSLVKECLEKTPESFDLYSREGDEQWTVGGDIVIFNPGSSVTYFKDRITGEIRKGTAKDMVDLVQLVDSLEHIKAQSTSIIPSDVSDTISDFYRLYLVLKYSTKPIITGAFRKQGLHDMKQLLLAAIGGEELSSKPRAIFDCCPSSPMIWSDVTSQNLVDCARSGIPAEIVPAPLMGATSPITISGTLVQSNAEILSGIVIAQLTKSGSPVVYGGAIAPMDMRYGTPRFGAIEAMIAACTSAEIGKHYGLPTHAYIGLSDSKMEDNQAGFESGLGAAMAAMTGINIVSGPGVLAQINCQSLGKLVIDNELCGSAYRLAQGCDVEHLETIVELIAKVGHGGDFMRQKHTSQNLRSEHFMPTEIIDRLTVDSWLEAGSKDIMTKANTKVNSILENISSPPLKHGQALEVAFKEALQRYDLDPSRIPCI